MNKEMKKKMMVMKKMKTDRMSSSTPPDTRTFPVGDDAIDLTLPTCASPFANRLRKVAGLVPTVDEEDEVVDVNDDARGNTSVANRTPNKPPAYEPNTTTG